MPDHVHLVVEAGRHDSDLVRFVNRFKQVTAFAYRQFTGVRLWQDGYYDRVLRSDDATDSAVRYVLGNPVRAGLAATIDEWPYSGSEAFDVYCRASARP